MRLLRRAALVVAVLAFAPLAFGGGSRDPSGHVRMPSSNSGAVTVYGAEWCPACKSLERSLKSRDIPFDVIDIERNPSAYAKAREEVRTNSIPITSVARASEMRWIVGADPNAVERAYRGE